MPANNTAAKRLTETDAKAIFSSLANNEQPPDGLDFRIIKVPQNGLKLSPPSLEFDGEASKATFSLGTALCHI